MINTILHQSAVEHAAALHRESNPTVPFEQVLAWHLQDGLVFAEDGKFLMARQGLWDGRVFLFGDVPSNCWFVYVAVGRDARRDLAGVLWNACDLPFVAWHSHGRRKLNVTRLERFL